MQQLPCGRKKSPGHAPKKHANADWKQRLEAYLKKEGLRSTRPRESVAEIALNQKTHFEIQELIREVQDTYPDISPATVYRSVKTLCEAGILSETLTSDGGVTLYEPHEDEHHDHIVCIDCGEIFEFHDESMEKAQNRTLTELRFKEAKHKHVIYAKCGYLNKK